MAGGPAGFTRDFSGPVLLGISPKSALRFVYRGITFCAGPFAWPSTTQNIYDSLPIRQNRLGDPTTPQRQRLASITPLWFGLFRVRSPLLTESQLFSLPVGTEMFHFPTFPLPALYIQAGVTRYARALAGFPHSDTLGSKLAYQFPEAYRRLLRPSSAPDAKASTVRP